MTAWLHFACLHQNKSEIFGKKCEMRPKWRGLALINKNTSQQLSGTVESGVVIVCRELCINANLRTSMNWNNASKTTCQFLRNDVKSYRKPFFKLLRRLLYNPLDHRVYFVYSILVLRQKHLFSHHCTCIWSSLLLCCWIGYTQSW